LVTVTPDGVDGILVRWSDGREVRARLTDGEGVGVRA